MRKKINDILIKPVTVLLFLSMLCMVLLVAAQVIFRHLSISVVWTEEVARLFFVWMMIFGIVLIEKENSQTNTELIIQKFPINVYIVWKGIIMVLEVGFIVCLFIGAIISIPQVKMICLGTIRALDYRLLYYPMIVCCPLIIWYLINQWIDLLVTKKKKEDFSDVEEKE